METTAGPGSVLIVTSWSKKGYDLYGQRMLESARRCGVEHLMFVASEDPHADRNTALDLEPLKRNLSDARYRKAAPRNQAAYLRWGAKVLALHAGMKVAKDRGVDWLVWLDGDTEWTQGPSQGWWDKVLPADCAVSALLRDGMGWEAETGFVGYRMGSAFAWSLIESMYDLYSTGAVFDMPQWWDGAVFSHLLPKHVPAHAIHNLAPEHPVSIHVWPESPLGICLKHNKGVGRKASASGGGIDDGHPSSLPGPAFGPKGRA